MHYAFRRRWNYSNILVGKFWKRKTLWNIRIVRSRAWTGNSRLKTKFLPIEYRTMIINLKAVITGGNISWTFNVDYRIIKWKTWNESVATQFKIIFVSLLGGKEQFRVFGAWSNLRHSPGGLVDKGKWEDVFRWAKLWSGVSGSSPQGKSGVVLSAAWVDIW
jgi:hypothetical protein